MPKSFGLKLAKSELSGKVGSWSLEFERDLILGAAGAASFGYLSNRAAEVVVPGDSGCDAVEDVAIAADVGFPLLLQRDPSCSFANSLIKTLYHKYKINQVFLNF